MDATSKVTLDAGGYEAGAQKIQAADRATASTAKQSFETMGAAATAGFSTVASGVDRATHSFSTLTAAAQKAGQVLEQAAKKMAAPWSNGPDESDAYRKWLQRADDVERAKKARDAIAQVQSPAAPGLILVKRPGERFEKHPLYSKPQRKGGDDEDEGDEGSHSSNNRFRNLELSHVARSVVDSLAAGQSPLRIIGQEAPRVLQAFGSSIGGLLKNIGPLGYTAAGAAVSVGALAFAVEKAHAAAEARNAERVKREVDVHGRDNKLSRKAASEGVDAAASDRLELEFDRRKQEIEDLVKANPKLGDTDLLKPLREEIDLRKQIADVQHVNTNSNFSLARDNAATTLGDAAGNPYDTSYHSKARDIAEANFVNAQSELDRTANAGLDTRDAQRKVDSAEVNRYQTVNTTARAGREAESQTVQMGLQLQKLDAMANLEKIRSEYNEKIVASEQAGTTEITAALRAQQAMATLEAQAGASDTPADRARGRSYRAALERGARAFEAHGGTRDADKEGGFARDATGPDSLIPDASAGLGAIDNPLNHSDFVSSRHNVVEENRPKAPPKPEDKAAQLELVRKLERQTESIDRLAAKLGIA